MRLRTLLLAGAVVPLALSHSALAAERGLERPVMILAQTEEECPVGTVCPPPADEEATQPAEEPVEEPQEQQAAPEEPVEEIQEQQAAPEEPVEEIQEQQAAPEEPVEEQQQQQAAPEEPADQPQEQQAQPTVGACPPGTDCPPAEEAAAPQPAAEEDTTVEQQLEAQGDREEANQVRSLREQLLDQLQRAVGVQTQEEPRADRRRRDGERDDGGRWRRDRFYERDDRRGEVVERHGGGIIIRLEGGGIYVEPDVPDEGGRLLYGADNVEVEQLRGGYTRTTVYRRDGTQIVTVRDRYGEIVLRSRVLRDGREIVLIDNRFDDDRRGSWVVRVPPPRISIPREQYIVDLGGASRQDIRQALLAPPVDTIERRYTLQEVLRSEEVRAYTPRVDLDTITFEFGSATIGVDQMPTLFALGEVMEDILRENPDEMYLIEGHTDLVGTDYDNLLLSHRRAEAVAVALSQNFDIPPENLITEGYGEQYPKIATEAPERRNRRAAVLRLTDLIAQN